MKLRLFVVLFFVSFHFAQAQNTLYFTDNESLYRKGLELLDKSNYAAARQLFERYNSLSGTKVNQLEAEYYSAFCALNLYHKDGEKMIDRFIRSNETHPKALLAYYDLGKHYFKQKNYKKAIRYLSKVNLTLVSKEESQDTRYKLGYSYFTQRKFNEALGYFNVLKTKKGPYMAASSYYAGYIAYQQGRYDEAVTDLERAQENEAYATVVPGILANLYYRQKRYDDLIAYSKKVLSGKNRVNTKDFYLLTADAYLSKGDYKKASEYYDLYDNQMKNPSADIRYRIGYANYRLGNFDEAITNLKRAASDRDSLGIYASYYLGIIYLKNGNKLYALTAFDVTRKSDINAELKQEASYQYAKVSYDLGRSKEAIEAMIGFIKTYPDNEHADEMNDLLSEAYLTTNNYDLAITHVESLRNVNISMQRVYQKAAYLRGSELFNKAEYAKALDMFRKALKYPVDDQYRALTNFWAGEAYSIGNRYQQAIDNYRSVLNNSGASGLPEYKKARYGAGYAYYNMKTYDKALINFKEYINTVNRETEKQYYEDALLRLADCYYVSKSYDNALNYYNQAVRLNKTDNDYAHLQAGTVLGIQGNVASAVNEYNYLIKNYPKSRYLDDALFQKGQLYLESGNYQEAAMGFTQLILKKPNSRFVPYGYMRRASSYYNLQQYDKTIADYEKVLSAFNTHSVAGEALLPLQEVLNLQGRSNEFDQYLTRYKKTNPDNKGLESVEFETAKNQYFNLDYNKAIQSFKNYIKQYPDNAKVEEGTYYIAESYYRLKEFEKALDHYNELMNTGTFAQLNRVIGRIGEIEFRSARYENAIYFYNQLADVASTKKEQYNAWSGLMESYYLLSEYDSVDHYAKVILERGNVNISSQNKASLFLGKSAFSQGNYEVARDEFLNTLNSARDEFGAEAQYLLGYIFYLEGKYHQSIEALIALNNHFNVYEEWVGKSYLLLADNYVKLEDFFQAKGTLNSVIENFPLEHIREQSRQKLRGIEALEAAERKEELNESDTLDIDIEVPEK
ncbi:tetratricopeptide repeat protein [Fulvivirga sp. M361]|uniref:tetratricopeptide repeat protein n=1 Tax=Fulvivirga sp. M361 TaxID=2594266 RepID=UPI00117B893E|nr:tetratricopeptide repeat protein [Fulvivirga sp. M361]TRX51415.1 tetratricopeptide repeat protein [Fulvivirga sp. M361]